MNEHNDKNDFYSFVDQVVSLKGADWFNAWSDSNPITNFHTHLSSDELSALILDAETTHISFIDYATMKKKLESDMREH